MSIRVTQLAYNSGVLSGLMAGRADDTKYGSGVQVCRNVRCTPQGPLENRPGFMRVLEAKYPEYPVRLIPFNFSADQTMIIELGEKYARFHTQGQTLMNEDGTAPYEIETPWQAKDLFQIHYTQNAEVMTLVHPYYPPQEIKRYSMRDWRISEVSLITSLRAPTGVKAERLTSAANDSNADKYTQKYVVTALTEDRTQESVKSSAASVVANLYATGTTVKVSWSSVSGAKYYRVYKLQGGIYGYIGETSETNIIDDNIAAETGETPPIIDDAFSVMSGITSIEVLNGGSGYSSGSIRGFGDWQGNSYPSGAPDTRDNVVYFDLEYSGTIYADRDYNSGIFGPWYWRTQPFKDLFGSSVGAKTIKYGTSGVRFAVDAVGGEPTFSGEVKYAASLSKQPGSAGGFALNTDRKTFYIVPATLEMVITPETEPSLGDQVWEFGVSITARCYTTCNPTIKSGGEGYTSGTIRVSSGSSPEFYMISGLSVTNGSGANYSLSALLPGGLDYFYSTPYARPYRSVAVTSPPVVVVTDPTGAGCETYARVSGGAIVAVDVLSPGSGYTDPEAYVSSSVGSGATFKVNRGETGSYPAAVGYFEQRRIFAGSRVKPQNIWMTATGTESNMTYHLPLQDDDRISFAVASRDLNQIQHVVALQQLIMLTSAAEWRVSPLNSDAITPTSISVRPQSYVGSSTVQPIMANNTAIYAAARGGHVREIAYSYNAGGYVSGDLSLRATALFDGNTVAELAFSKEPFNTVWAVSSSGSLLGLTYVPEQSVGAWFEYKTAGVFESVAVVQEGEDDVVYVVVNREINGERKRVIECSTNRKAGVFLDCAGVYDGDETTTVSGVTWLAGDSVTVNADGFVFDGITVGEDGTVALPIKAKRVVVGLPYSVEVQTMPIVAQVSDGSLAKGHTKNIKRVWLRLSESAAPEVGPDFENMAQVKTRSREPFGTPPENIDGVVEVIPPGEWKEDTGVCIRMSKPLPFTLISHSAEIELGG